MKETRRAQLFCSISARPNSAQAAAPIQRVRAAFRYYGLPLRGRLLCCRAKDYAGICRAFDQGDIPHTRITARGGKGQARSAEFERVGAISQCATGQIRASLHGRIATRYRGELQTVLSESKLNPGDAAKLSGNISDAETPIFSRPALEILQPFSVR